MSMAFRHGMYLRLLTLTRTCLLHDKVACEGGSTRTLCSFSQLLYIVPSKASQVPLYLDRYPAILSSFVLVLNFKRLI